MKLKNSVNLFCLFLLLVQGVTAVGQSHFQTVTGQLGYGKEFSDNVDYKTYMLVGDWSRSFKTPKKKDFLAWYGQLQFNVVKATNTAEGKLDYEFGLNLGLRNHIRLSNDVILYQMLGSGPHYISAELDRQADGFIFSDNLAVGCYIHAVRNYFLNLQFGLRHISNANIELPNRGVNSYIISIGFSGIK